MGRIPIYLTTLLFGSFHFSFFVLVDEVTKNENRSCDFLYDVFRLQGKKGKTKMKIKKFLCTGKSLSEALLFAEHGENMCTKIVLNVRNNFCTQHVLPRFELGIFMY